jgi:hypothetical protein
LLWIHAIATAHFLRHCQLDVQLAIRAFGSAIAATGCGCVSGVEDFFEFHLNTPGFAQRGGLVKGPGFCRSIIGPCAFQCGPQCMKTRRQRLNLGDRALRRAQQFLRMPAPRREASGPHPSGSQGHDAHPWRLVRVYNPADSSRLSSGVKVPESSVSRVPSSETVSVLLSQSTSMTRYCGYVSPSSLRIGL